METRRPVHTAAHTARGRTEEEFPTLRLLLCALLCLGTLACKLYYPAGEAAIAQYVFGGEETKEAFSDLSEALTDGEPIAQAVSAFYGQLSERA